MDGNAHIMTIILRLLCFGSIGFITAYSGYGINTWQFWLIVILAIVIYLCGVIEEHLKK